MKRESDRLPLRAVVWLCMTMVVPVAVNAQGDGPRIFAPRPVGLQALSPYYLYLHGNLNIEQTVLLDGAELSANIGGLAYTRFFALAGRVAQAYGNVAWATVSGSVEPGGPFAALPDQRIPRFSGAVDPTAAFRLGLFGTPALTRAEFARTRPTFQGSVVVAVSPPIGEYDPDRFFNIGRNRWLFRFGLPFVVPIGDPRPAHQTLLELTPGVLLHSDNTDPPGPARRVEKAAIYVVETHLSRNFNPAIWGSIDARYQNGGETTADGQRNRDALRQLGAGVTLASAVADIAQLSVSYARIVARSDGSEGWLFRMLMVIAW